MFINICECFFTYTCIHWSRPWDTNEYREKQQSKCRCPPLKAFRMLSVFPVMRRRCSLSQAAPQMFAGITPGLTGKVLYSLCVRVRSQNPPLLAHAHALSRTCVFDWSLPGIPELSEGRSRIAAGAACIAGRSKLCKHTWKPPLMWATPCNYPLIALFRRAR